MADVPRASEIRGRTMRWTWTEGPTKGTTHEHVFHDDGTVEWRDAASPKKEGEEKEPKERVPYAASKVANGVFLVSYLAKSGFTLTVALNFQDSKLTGIASGADQ